jgi:hypothetical protein
MQSIIATAQAAFLLVVVLMIGWTAVYLASSMVERKLRGRRAIPNIWSSFSWVWDNSNAIGIPTLILGTLYIVWAMYYGPGLGSETLLILMLMAAAGMLIGFAPGLRRR